MHNSPLIPLLAPKTQGSPKMGIKLVLTKSDPFHD